MRNEEVILSVYTYTSADSLQVEMRQTSTWQRSLFGFKLSYSWKLF